MSVLAGFAALGFVAVFGVDGWTRPGYHPRRQPVSALALGERGWIQTANFILCGAVIAAGGVAITTRAWPLGLATAVFGVALAASGLFRMDPMRGYPPGTPDVTPKRYSRRHQIHDAAGAVVFAGMPVLAVIGALTPALGTPIRLYSAVTALATAVLAGRFAAAWENDDDNAGLLQRLALAVGLGWVGVVFFALSGQFEQLA